MLPKRVQTRRSLASVLRARVTIWSRPSTRLVSRALRAEAGILLATSDCQQAANTGHATHKHNAYIEQVQLVVVLSRKRICSVRRAKIPSAMLGQPAACILLLTTGATAFDYLASLTVQDAATEAKPAAKSADPATYLSLIHI